MSTRRGDHSDVFEVNPLVNKGLKMMLKVDAWFFNFITYPIGSTLVVAAVKK
jgi:hypothetical protein